MGRKGPADGLSIENGWWFIVKHPGLMVLSSNLVAFFFFNLLFQGFSRVFWAFLREGFWSFFWTFSWDLQRRFCS